MKLTRHLLFISILALWAMTVVVSTDAPTEAPAAFDASTNGLVDQATHDADAFTEQEAIADGLGPVYNAQSCGECHQNPVTGGNSQVFELRAGSMNGRLFVDHPGGSLVHSRAIDAALQERVLPGNPVRSLRSSLGLLGDGFVEVIADSTLMAIADAQPAQSNGFVRGQAIMVPVLEDGGQLRVGRFGHKNQHASLVSFSADAYLNEMGITSQFLPAENTSNGIAVDAFDTVADPEDDDNDVEAFARFIRATKAPPRDLLLAATLAAQAGEQTFNAIGCRTCHVATIRTAPTGTFVNGTTFQVPAALGDKLIHPYGDFLLHDIGTGDGIVQNGGQATRNRVRTIPLWGLRTRSRFMHDGESLTLSEAIARHQGEAILSTISFNVLSQTRRQQLLQFLLSL